MSELQHRLEAYVLTLFRERNTRQAFGLLSTSQHVLFWGLSAAFTILNKRWADFERIVSEHTDSQRHVYLPWIPAFTPQDSSINYKEALTRWILDTQTPEGGFAALPGHPSQLTSTVYALRSLKLLGNLSRLKDIDRISKWIQGCQNSDGSFAGEGSGDIDGRYVYCALLALETIDRLDQVDLFQSVNWLMMCNNEDGGFGCWPRAESHAAYTYCALASLALLGCSHFIDVEKTREWLAYRQQQSGEMNGRAGKRPDVCYAWWVLASLEILNSADRVDRDQIMTFIHSCIDEESGGIADRPGNNADIFHTLFASLAFRLCAEGGDAIDVIHCEPRS